MPHVWTSRGWRSGREGVVSVCLLCHHERVENRGHAPGLVSRLRAAGCVFARDEARLLVSGAATAADLEEMVGRRVAGEPLEQILGWVSFGGLCVALRPGVFVPRLRTEFLAGCGVSFLAHRSPAHRSLPVVVELCCGSGAVAMVLMARAQVGAVYAVDLQSEAVECARCNLPEATVLQGDLFSALPRKLRGRVDVVIANAPYVPTGALAMLPREARDYEPAATLDGGGDGLELVRRIISEAPQWLAAGGQLLLECSEEQAEAVGQLLAAAGLVPRILRSAETDATVAVGSGADAPQGHRPGGL